MRNVQLKCNSCALASEVSLKKISKMKLNALMPLLLKPHYQKELTAYKTELKKRRLQQAWRHLERAHILGQPYPYQHSQVHWLMLKFGIHIKNSKEILGQIPRLMIGGG